MTGPDRAAISIWGRSNDNYIKGITIRNLTIRAADDCTRNYMLQAARCRGLTLSHMVFDCEPNTQSRSCMDFYGAYEDMLVENCVFPSALGGAGGRRMGAHMDKRSGIPKCALPELRLPQGGRR